MTLLDAAIPFSVGVVLVGYPEIFWGRSSTATDADFAKKYRKFRTIGYVLLGVAAINFMLAVARH